VTGGFWDSVYSGAFGQVRAGLQYSYMQRNFFPGTVGLPKGSAPLGADTNVSRVTASLRAQRFAESTAFRLRTLAHLAEVGALLTQILARRCADCATKATKRRNQNWIDRWAKIVLPHLATV
jgi:hypothetical protein